MSCDLFLLTLFIDYVIQSVQEFREEEPLAEAKKKVVKK